MSRDHFQHRVPIGLWIKEWQKSQTASGFFEFPTFSTHPTTTTITTIIYPYLFISASPGRSKQKRFRLPHFNRLMFFETEKDKYIQEIFHEIHYKQIRFYACARTQHGNSIK
jgi:hypothetical protein